MLKLGQLKDLKTNDIWMKCYDWGATPEDKNRFKILVAYINEGDWGCDSSGYFLLQEKTTGKYFEVYGSHCSCYGFEDQWTPRQATLKYLKSSHFTHNIGGYDEVTGTTTVSEWIKENL